MPRRSLGPFRFAFIAFALVACPQFAAVGQQLRAADVVAEFKVPPSPRVVLLPWTRDSQVFYFVIDTGAAFSAVNDRAFPGLRERGTQDLGSHAGDIAQMMCDPPDIAVGPIRFGSLKSVMKVDCTTMSQRFGRQIGGIIGMDALRSFVVQFDFDNGCVRFLKSNAVPHEGWVKLPLSYDSALTPCIRATVDGQAAHFVVDTGYTGDGFLPEWWVDRMAKSSKTVTGEAVTLTGSSKYRLIRAKDCELAGAHHAGLLLSDSKIPRPGLGIRFFGQYVTTFDFPNDVLYLKKGKRFGAVTENGMSGLQVMRATDAVTVRRVYEGSPAALAGVEAGDEVMQLNKFKSEDADLDDLRDELSSGDGNEIHLRLRRAGVIREVQFRLKKTI